MSGAHIAITIILPFVLFLIIIFVFLLKNIILNLQLNL